MPSARARWSALLVTGGSVPSLGPLLPMARERTPLALDPGLPFPAPRLTTRQAEGPAHRP
jgi:hypothetical protein